MLTPTHPHYAHLLGLLIVQPLWKTTKKNRRSIFNVFPHLFSCKEKVGDGVKMGALSFGVTEQLYIIMLWQWMNNPHIWWELSRKKKMHDELNEWNDNTLTIKLIRSTRQTRTLKLTWFYRAVDVRSRLVIHPVEASFHRKSGQHSIFWSILEWKWAWVRHWWQQWDASVLGRILSFSVYLVGVIAISRKQSIYIF